MDINVLVNSEFTKPVAKVELTHKEQICKCIALQKVILVSLAELSQYRDGLYKIEKIKQYLIDYSSLLEPFFCMNKSKLLTAGIFTSIMKYSN